MQFDESQHHLVAYNPQGNVNPLERLTAATQLMTFKGREAVIEGPAGTGKSLANLHHANLVLCKYPRARVLLCRKTRSSLTESGMVTYERSVIGPGSTGARPNLELYPDANAVQRNQRHSYRYPNGSEMVCAGLDTPERILSTEFDLIVVLQGEELTKTDWEMLLTRLRNWVVPYQQITADVNPTYPAHWLNQRMLQGVTTRLVSRHEDNPRLWDGRNWTDEGRLYLDGLRSMTGSRYDRLYLGKWAAAEGIVYPDFNAKKHVIKPFMIDPRWKRYRSIDFGVQNPFVCQWWALSPDGVLIRYALIYKHGVELDEHIPEIKRLSIGERYEATVCDRDPGARMKLHRNKIYTKLAWKSPDSVREGISAVSMRLRAGWVPSEDGDAEISDMARSAYVPGLMPGVKICFFENEDGYGLIERDPILAEKSWPASDVEEFDSYAYKEVKEDREADEEPRKRFDHGMDATRYLVCEVDDVASTHLKCRGGRARTRRNAA